jgi:hypothetical protein
MEEPPGEVEKETTVMPRVQSLAFTEGHLQYALTWRLQDTTKRGPTMSKIVVVVNGVPGERRTEVLARLRAITGSSLGELRRCLDFGDPVMEVLLFRNDHETIARRLRQLISDMPILGTSLHLFELAPDQRFVPQTGGCEITPEILTNILDASEASKGCQQEMWDKFGHI